MRAVLIANPTAHNVTTSSFRVVERALEATFDMELVTTEARGHAAEIARDAALSGAKSVVVYAGDGTLNEAINGLVGATGSTDVVVGILPGGGTNVLARNLGYPNDLVEATAHLIDLVQSRRCSSLGLGRLSATTADRQLERFFALGAGLVLDAEIVRRVDRSGWRPRLHDWAFVLQGLRAFFSIRRQDGPPLRIRTDDGEQEAWWSMCVRTDPLTYMGKRGIRVSPGVEPEGGLDLVAARSVKVVRTARWLTRAMTSGRHLPHKDLIHVSGRESYEVDAVRPVPLQVDGEDLGDVLSLRVQDVPRALPVWA